METVVPPVVTVPPVRVGFVATVPPGLVVPVGAGFVLLVEDEVDGATA